VIEIILVFLEPIGRVILDDKMSELTGERFGYSGAG
jgi:hypothetical protein